jgi:hypothetical protein
MDARMTNVTANAAGRSTDDDDDCSNDGISPSTARARHNQAMVNPRLRRLSADDDDGDDADVDAVRTHLVDKKRRVDDASTSSPQHNGDATQQEDENAARAGILKLIGRSQQAILSGLFDALGKRDATVLGDEATREGLAQDPSTDERHGTPKAFFSRLNTLKQRFTSLVTAFPRITFVVLIVSPFRSPKKREPKLHIWTSPSAAHLKSALRELIAQSLTLNDIQAIYREMGGVDLSSSATASASGVDLSSDATAPVGEDSDCP